VCSLLRRVDRRDRLDGLLRARIEGFEQHIEEPDPNLVLADLLACSQGTSWAKAPRVDALGV
jgi:hypothetical protein